MKLISTMLALSLAMPAGIARGDESVTIDLGGEGGAQRVAGSSGDIDKKVPVAGDVLFTAAPGDLITMKLQGSDTFRGKTVSMNAEAVKFYWETETVAIFFKRKVKKLRPTLKSSEDSTTLTVGQQIQVSLEIAYLDGTAGPRLPLLGSGERSFKLRKAAKIRLRIDWDHAAVAWENRTTLQDDERQVVDAWLNGLRGEGFDEVHERETGVSKGDLESLTVVVKASRP